METAFPIEVDADRLWELSHEDPPPEVGEQVIPAGLDRMEPGPVLAGWLAAIDVNRVSGYDRVALLRAHQRMASHYRAQVYEDMAAIADHFDELEPDDFQLAHDGASAEVRAALRLTRRSADAELDVGVDLWRRLPRVGRALAAGLIDVPRARVLRDGTCHLPEETARRVIGDIIDEAPRWTTGQLRARLRRICIEADPEEAERRYEGAVAERGVFVLGNPDGTVELTGVNLPQDGVVRAMRNVERLARSLHGPGEPRTMDQLRADVTLDLLSGQAVDSEPGHASGGMVDLHVDLATLAGLSDAPGELAGYGPVIADIARQIADRQHRAEWRWVATHPESGEPVAVGTTRRRPTAGQRRWIEARDRTCVFPGCRAPARNCDIDHRIAYAEGGPTEVDELAPGCRHDHNTLKHRCGWSYVRLADGDHLWTSPLGHTYTTSGRDP